MPTYSYLCNNCGYELTVLKRMTDAGTVEFCPSDKCRSLWQPMDRVYNAPPAAKVAGGTPRFHVRRVRQP